MAKVKTTKKKEVVLRLEDVLFHCRDIMRGKANGAIQRDVILTFVFLKFLNERFDKQREKVKAELEETGMPLNLFGQGRWLFERRCDLHR